MPDALEYLVTLNAHDPDALTRHMNHMARDGWKLLTVDFAIRGETGFHTFFWQRQLRAADPGNVTLSGTPAALTPRRKQRQRPMATARGKAPASLARECVTALRPEATAVQCHSHRERNRFPGR